MEQAIINKINETVKESGGNIVQADSLYYTAEIDSLDTTYLFIELDDEFNLFGHIPESDDPFTYFDWETLTVQDIIDLCILNSTTT